MARMHSRKKGKTGSSRPFRTTAPEWVEYDPKEVEELVVKYGKEGLGASAIGTLMRDQNGVPLTKLSTGKRITQILDEKGLVGELPEDLLNLIRRAVAQDKHMKDNHKDMSSKRGMQLTEAKIRRLVKYYKLKGRIPQDWKYNIKTAKLLVK